MQSSLISLSSMERVHIGTPVAEAAAQEAELLGASRVFVVCSGTLNSQTDEIQRVIEALGERFVGLFDAVRPHVPREDVIAATLVAAEADPDMLLCVGGGSATDLTKILAVTLEHGIREASDMDGYHLQVNPDTSVTAPSFSAPSIPVVVAPTTLAGGEFNALAGSTDEKTNVKEGYVHPAMTPRAVILDPALTRHTPEWLWLSTGVRALDHAFETLGSLESNGYYDGMAMNAIRLLSEGLVRVKEDAGDLEARRMCQVGAWSSMVAIVAGLDMGISHAVGHALGGSFKVPHGYTSCVMAPFALEYNREVNEHRQALISVAFGEPQTPAHELADSLIRRLGMPRSLGEVGLSEDDLPSLAAYTFKDIWCGTNPNPIANADALVPLLRRAL
ncbi:iron-containing alcohol dehydrogenase [Dietzia sp. CQ4]|uniref:iron-containing alcohol dehydrogenase n=1 Tax=Dietzia TaxID=37914 RepID=UPI0015F9B060|nr:iron-containing alcohol dehydrogenase [Dietzia sp. CQ4]MBB1039925.1 iron-containing alcohol dehydrogenase [Dietzia sp. Cai40]MBB1044568.1 iron-containing alcohol dehydrogenase [Dietzia sp. DQ11-44]